jgi:SHS2 domain-containing protein
MQITYFDETVLADVGARISADSLPQLVTGAAGALLGVLISEPAQLPAGRASTLVVHGDTPAALVRAVLEELVFRKDAEGAVFDVTETELQRDNGARADGSAGDHEADTPPTRPPTAAPDAAAPLEARISARRVELAEAPDLLGVDVKAVTFHDFRVTERDDGGWEASVVFDV